MDITGKTALVTGANRGLGRQLVAQLCDRGAKVYAGVRNPQSVDLEGVTPIALDITDPTSVATAADATGDVSTSAPAECGLSEQASRARGPGRVPLRLPPPAAMICPACSCWRAAAGEAWLGLLGGRLA